MNYLVETWSRSILYLLAFVMLVSFAILSDMSQNINLRLLRLNATHTHTTTDEEYSKHVINHDTQYDIAHHDTHTLNSIKSQSIREKHPNCFIKTMFNNSEFLYKDSTYYELIGNNSTHSMRYDHLCQYMMKNRYNCGTTEKPMYGGNAYDWKLMLGDQGKEGRKCNLWNLIYDLQGPAAIGKKVLDDFQTLQGSDRIKRANQRSMINVAMLGNSYLRQIFESFVCTWSHEITLSLFEKDGKYDESIAGMKLRNYAPLTLDELGNMENLPSPDDNRCHLDYRDQYYEEGLEIPPNCKGYSDNLAVAEFGGSMRIYYMFRPWMHLNLTRVMKEKLNLIPEELDILIFNDEQEKIIEKDAHLIEVFKASGAWNNRITWDYEHFRTIQERDVGRWFSANNPWITNPPDGHACMPGPPDDEVNLLLYLIYTNSFIRK